MVSEIRKRCAADPTVLKYQAVNTCVSWAETALETMCEVKYPLRQDNYRACLKYRDLDLSGKPEAVLKYFDGLVPNIADRYVELEVKTLGWQKVSEIPLPKKPTVKNSKEWSSACEDLRYAQFKMDRMADGTGCVSASSPVSSGYCFICEKDTVISFGHVNENGVKESLLFETDGTFVGFSVGYSSCVSMELDGSFGNHPPICETAKVFIQTADHFFKDSSQFSPPQFK